VQGSHGTLNEAAEAVDTLRGWSNGYARGECNGSSDAYGGGVATICNGTGYDDDGLNEERCRSKSYDISTC
jgi:hypothetical protein